MKKILSLVLAVVCSTALFAQVMSSSGANNTLSTSFGRGYDNVNADHSGKTYYHGFVDTFQVRFDVSKFTVEAMLNWGILYNPDNKNVVFENTEKTPFWFTNHISQGGWWTNGNTENYYVNFFVNPVEGLNIGAGTRLNWRVGAAPSSGAYYWEPTAHVVQGGLKDGIPGSADVVGFAYYANKYTSNYANHTNAALGIRYRYKDIVEVGLAIPNGTNTDSFAFNAGLNVHPVDMFSISVAYDGIMLSKGNLFIGSSLFFNNFTLNLFVGANFRPDSSNGDTNHKVGFGTSAVISIPKINMTIKPELAFTDYTNPNYTFGWYLGSRFDIGFAEHFKLGTWISFANGARNKNWVDDPVKENWDGGFVFNIHPDFTWQINDRHGLSVFYDYQNRKSYNDYQYDVWAAGLTWSYKY